PERAVEGRPADRLAAPAVAPRRWGHAEPLLRIAVETAGPGIARVINRVGHAAVLLERGLRPLPPQSPGIFRRRHAEVALEQALEMVRSVTDRLCQLRERRRLLGGFDGFHGLSDGLAVPSDLVGLAAQARAVARGARLLARREVAHM